jgi:phosphatidylglycerol:prolipoprotein diacylglycerol transferase
LHPVLFTFQLGQREIALHTYGLLIAAGLAIGIAVAHREGRRRGLDGGRVLDLAFWLTVSGLVGSRLAYGLVNARDFARACRDGGGSWWHDCTRLFQVWEGGLVFYGGVAAAAAVAWAFARRQGWSFGDVGDLFAPALAIGHAFGRLGCFAAGCCFGKETASRLGVAFPRGSVAFDVLESAGAIPPGSGETPPLHPTQLYEAAGELALFALLCALRPRLRRRPGALLLVYLGLYAILRFVVEIYRGDVLRGFLVAFETPRLAAWLGLPPAEPIFFSVGQLGSLVVVAAVAVALARWRQVGEVGNVGNVDKTGDRPVSATE